MSSRRLLARIPTAKFITTATLKEHELKFHKISQVDYSGKCDIYFTENINHVVYGVVYDVDISDKQKLDIIEGLGVGYDEKVVSLTADKQARLDAITYFATTIDPKIKPYHWYKEHVVRGAREYGLPPDYIARYIDVEAVDDVDSARHARELSIYFTK